MTVAQGLCQSFGHFGFGLNDFGTCFLRLGFHFLFGGDSHGTAFLGLGLRDVFVGVGLVDLQGGPDVLTYVDVGNVDGQDFKSRTGIQTLFEYQFGDGVRIFQNLLVVFGRSDGRNDTFAYTGQDGVLACTSHQLVDVGAYGDTGFRYQLDTVFGYGGHGWRVDYLRIDGSLHGLEHVAAGQVYGRGLFKRQVDVGFRCRNQGMYHALHMSARHVVGFQIVAGDVLQTGLMGFDEAWHNDAGRHVTDAHQE